MAAGSAGALAVLFVACCLARVGGEVVGALVMPHGGIALDPTYFNTTNQTSKKEAWALHDACETVASLAATLKPDTILLSTPHGVSDLSLFEFFLNPQGQGWADTDNCGCPPCCYNVSVTIDSNSSLSLVHQLQASLSMSKGDLACLVWLPLAPPAQEDADPFPLRWGEVIPLHFLTSHLPTSTKVMILSQPSRRYTDSVAMIPELLALGSRLYEYLHPLPQRVLVVISADLAHTHQASGPYGYSNASEPFDQACGTWASSLNSVALLGTAAKYVDRALSCGYTGLVMLHGLMSTRGWDPKLYANYHPSYYGMMVASFTPT